MTAKQVAVLTAVITAIGVAVAAFGVFKDPNVQQKSSGEKSPNVGVVGGDVTISN